MRSSTRLKALLQQPKLVLAPGVYDGLTARVAEQAGFDALYMTGAGVSASLGYPDFGLVTMTEMVDRAAVITRSTTIPVLSDADTGYGNELNVTRTVREFEARGVAAIHIEDQVSPKRCGHLDGKDVIAKDEYLSKIKAALLARQDPDFLIVARTDAGAVNGLDDAIGRANAALALGADMAFVEAPSSLEEVEAIPERVNGPCLLNIVQGGRTPVFDMNQVEAMGYRMAIVPGAVLLPTLLAVDPALRALATSRMVENVPEGTDLRQLFGRMGAGEWMKVQKGILS